MEAVHLHAHYGRWAEKVCHVYLARPVCRMGPPAESDHRPLFLPPRAALGALALEAEADFLSRALALAL